MTNQNELSIEYADVIKAYQNKVNDLTSQLIAAEAKLIASANFISKMTVRLEQLESENIKLTNKNKKVISKIKQEEVENVIDYIIPSKYTQQIEEHLNVNARFWSAYCVVREPVTGDAKFDTAHMPCLPTSEADTLMPWLGEMRKKFVEFAYPSRRFSYYYKKYLKYKNKYNLLKNKTLRYEHTNNIFIITPNYNKGG
jgi:hypothetical protein